MPSTTKSQTAKPSRLRFFSTLPFLAVFGPGLVVMLADTDVGSIITAGQSGVQWGYKLLAVQLILVPILYVCLLYTSRCV